MKNLHYEQRRRQMREYHRQHPWRLDGGFYIPHAYPDPKKLSWWDDVGFILNGRRVIVWWQHPRWVYYDAIEKQALAEVPVPATPSTLEKFLSGQEPGQKTWCKLGRSRKKVISATMPKSSDEWIAYYDAVNALEDELMRTGIALEVAASMRVEQLKWATGVSLILPIEVLNKEDVRALAALAKRLLKRETTVADEFPGYVYRREQWLLEATFREKRRRTDETAP
ncbi:MAG: hypothetical protein PHV45_08125 [Desulfuromonas thiophila]|nr:hypothetical protein [Desulfuromonas thiophila]